IRAISGLGYTLTLTDVYERGWTTSTVTKYKTDWDNQRIIYSQYFPEKWLEGNYEFKPGFAVIRPLINELVSTAFTHIWSASFKDFPLERFIKG
ncbi:Takeout/JHBP like protein, partial [Operophtera brumata]